jgi:hypothetical protein
MSDPRRIVAALDRVTIAMADLRRLIVAEVGDDAGTVEETPADRLRARCTDLGLDVVDSAVSEQDAARLLGRSTSWLRRRRGEGAAPPWRRVLGRYRYELQGLANYLEGATEYDC